MQLIAGFGLAHRRRGPFLAPLEIIAVATMVGALLFLLFPGRDFGNPSYLARPDDLSMAYLRMLLRAQPQQAEARLLLVQEQMALGRLDDAHDTLAPLRGRSDGLGYRADFLAVQLDRTRLFALPPDHPQRQALQDQVRRAAAALIPRSSRSDDLDAVAGLLLALGDPGAAAAAARRLASLDVAHAVGWLEKAAAWSHAAGDVALAAQLYGEAARGVSDPVRGVRLAREALRVLLAADQGKAGLSLVGALVERFPVDLHLLEQAVAMAVAAQDMDRARRWGQQRLDAAGGNTAALRQQVDILLKAGAPAEALKLARTLWSRTPDNRALRRQMAQLARWSAQPEEAMAHWTWLARKGDEEARENALELAGELNDENTQAEMLEIQMKRAKRMTAPRIPAAEPGPVSPADPIAPPT